MTARARVMAPLLLLAGGSAAEPFELSGYVSLEPRLFLEQPAFDAQPSRGLSWSAVLAPELRYDAAGGRHLLMLAPHARIDQHDDSRNRVDLREASWLHVNGPWTLRVGLSKVFWGVTESRHLVDIVNQTDFADDIDSETKLGQPMLQIERWTDQGTLALFVLPGFRERTFPDDDARLRGPLPIATGRAEYESGAGDRRTDLALRWRHALGAWDIGLSAFHGTSREPRFVVMAGDAGVVLVPHYDVITQLGADVQHTRGAWLWKLEAIARDGHADPFAAAVAGFEHTFYGLLGTGVDLGVLGEVLYDGRDAAAPPALFGDGIFAGLRLALNDLDNTSLLAGVLLARGGTGTFTVIEAQRRIGEAWTLELEARLLSNVAAAEPFLSGFRNDSQLTLRAAWHF